MTNILRRITAFVYRPVRIPRKLVPLGVLFRHWVITDVVFPFAVTRVMLLLVASIAMAIIPYKTWRYMMTFDVSARSWINVLSRWDGTQYLLVAQKGYSYVPDDQSNIAFFPLYPLLIRAGGMITGHMNREWVAVVGICISNLALLVFLAVLVFIIRKDFSENTAKKAVWYYLIFPTTIFLSSVYAESLCLALSAGALWFAYNKRWWAACILAALAAFARPNGFLIGIPIAFEYFRERKWNLRSLNFDVAAFLFIPLPVLGYFWYLQMQFGNFFAYINTLTYYNQRFMFPTQTIQNVFNGPFTVHSYQHSLLELYSVVLMGICMLLTFRYLRPSLIAYTLIMYTGLLSTGTLDSNMRYWLPVFPLFITLALVGNRTPWFDRLFTFAAIALSSLFTVMLALWYPVA